MNFADVVLISIWLMMFIVCCMIWVDSIVKEIRVIRDEVRRHIANEGKKDDEGVHSAADASHNDTGHRIGGDVSGSV